MEKVDFLFLFVGFLIIFLVFIFGKMVRWEDYVLRLWRRYFSKMFFFGYILFSLVVCDYVLRILVEFILLFDLVFFIRFFCGVLILLIIFIFIGKVCYGFVFLSLYRVLLVSVKLLCMKCKLF